MLFTVGGLFALYEAYLKWHETHDDPSFDPFESQWWWVPVLVLAVAIVLESFSFRTAIVESNKVRGKRSCRGVRPQCEGARTSCHPARRPRGLAGSDFRVLRRGAHALTGNPIFDVIGTTLIGVLLVAVAIFLAVEMKSLLLGSRQVRSTSPASSRRSSPSTASTG